MTCIVGIARDGHVIIGGDAIASNGAEAGAIARPKVFARDGIVFGYSTSFRFGQLLEFGLAVPERRMGEGTDAFVFRLCNAIRHCVDEHGALWKDPTDQGGNALLAVDGRLFELLNNFAVVEYARGYAVAGCGYLIGLGALFATEDWTDQRARALKALRAAVALDPNVRPPFTFIETAPDGAHTLTTEAA